MYMSKLNGQATSNWDWPTVSLKSGKVRGVEKDGGYIFRSLPYATAERFMKADSVNYANGLYIADHYTCVCPELLTPVPQDQYYNPHFFLPQHEDCLNLNIWTQHLEQEAMRPVIVWLGNGNWEKGAVNELFASDGENLSRSQDCVIAAVNHRANCLGALDLSERGEQYKSSGQIVMHDLLAALNWIKSNIACFGGDPDNITLFAQGDAAQKIFALMMIRDADGLFDKVVIDGAVPEPLTSPESAQKFAEILLKANEIQTLLGCDYWVLAEVVLDTAEEYNNRYGKYSFAPVVDGDYISPDHFIQRLKSTSILIGGCKDDAHPRQQEYAAEIAGYGGNVWSYLFDIDSDFLVKRPAWSGADIAYWFGNAEYIESLFEPKVTPAIQTLMTKIIGEFARTGYLPWNRANRDDANTFLISKTLAGQ